MKVSISALNSFLSCRRAFDYRYRQNLARRPDTLDVGPMQVGSVIHAGIEGGLRWYHENDYADTDGFVGGIVAAVNAWLLDISDVWNLSFTAVPLEYDGIDPLIRATVDAARDAAGIAERFIRHLDVPARYRVVEHEGQPLLEYAFEYEVHPNLTFVGRIDAVLKDLHTGAIIAVDFKTTERFNAWDAYETDRQLPLYVYFLRKLTGLAVNSGSYWQVRRKLPQTPTLNKDGSMSRRKIATTWEVYREALLEAGLDPADYGDMADKLAEDVYYWYQELNYTFSEGLLDAYWQATQPLVAQLADDNDAVGSFNFVCRSCHYRELCLAEMEGDEDEAELLRHTMFEPYHEVEDGETD